MRFGRAAGGRCSGGGGSTTGCASKAYRAHAYRSTGRTAILLGGLLSDRPRSPVDLPAQAIHPPARHCEQTRTCAQAEHLPHDGISVAAAAAAAASDAGNRMPLDDKRRS